MNTIIVKADNKVTKALISIFEAFGVAFEVKKEKNLEESPYDPEFVSKVLGRAKSVEEGNAVEYNDELRNKLFQQGTY